MQSHAEATLTHEEGRRIWLGMLADVNGASLMAPAIAEAATKLVVLSALLASGLHLAWTSEGWLLACAWLGLALLLAQFAFIGHDAGHGALSARAGVNRALGQVSMTLATGLAFDEWIARHRAHHRHCQDEARDPDMA